MSPELINAIKERIALGRTKEEIEAEVVATGYTAEQFSLAYEAATQSAAVTTNLTPDTTYYARTSTSTGALISISDLVGKMWDLMKEQKGMLGKTIGVSFLILLAVAALGVLLFLVAGEASSFLAWLMLGYFVLMLGYSFLYAGMIRALLRRHAPTPLTEHIKWTLRHIGTLFVVGLMALGVMYTGFLFLIIPGFLFAMYLSMTVNLVIDERARGLDALIMSTKYVYGRFWPVFVRLFITGLVAGLISFVIMMIGFFTIFLAPITFLVAMIISYYGTACAWVILYESLLQAGPVKSLPVSDSTLRSVYVVAGVVGAIVYLGFMGWSMFDTVSELSTLFT